MICKQCGNEIAPDAKFCGVCGAPNEAPQPQQFTPPVEQPQYAQPQYDQPQQYADPQYGQPQYGQPQYGQPQYAQPQYGQPQYGNVGMEDTKERSLSKQILIFGILGISFACTYYLSFLGIIFGAIALSKAKAYGNAGYALTGRAKTGRILGMVGLILGIVLVAILVIVIIIAIIAAESYSNYYNFYY